MSNVMKYVSIVSFVFVLTSPIFSPARITEESNMTELRYGFPFPFVEQWSSLTPPDEVLPITVIIGNPMENPTKIILSNFILSYIAIVIVLTALVAGVRLVDKKQRSED